MNIGDVAKATGVTGKTIRYYEQIGLVDPAGRASNGYRVYDRGAVEILRFVKRARGLGFTLKEVGDLLALWSDDQREAGDVRRLAKQHLDTIETRIREFEALARTLEHLIDRCEGGDRPHCPILDDLADAANTEE